MLYGAVALRRGSWRSLVSGSRPGMARTAGPGARSEWGRRAPAMSWFVGKIVDRREERAGWPGCRGGVSGVGEPDVALLFGAVFTDFRRFLRQQQLHGKLRFLLDAESAQYMRIKRPGSGDIYTKITSSGSGKNHATPCHEETRILDRCPDPQTPAHPWRAPGSKSTLVRLFVKRSQRKLHEVDLERHPELDEIFASRNTSRILSELEYLIDEGPIDDHASLLFLDEIQAAPSVIAALRSLHEDRPDLPIIAAGSLLEFVLADHAFSMPVGRIEYLFLEPMGFEEFLAALDETSLLELLRTHNAFPGTAHARLLGRLRDYMLAGGMPEAVGVFAETDRSPAGSVHDRSSRPTATTSPSTAPAPRSPSCDASTVSSRAPSAISSSTPAWIRTPGRGTSSGPSSCSSWRGSSGA